MAHKTQIERIEEYINEYGSITPMDAFMDLGITKLATRISTMIRSGYAIKKTMQHGRNRWGQPINFMSYAWLEDINSTNDISTIKSKCQEGG